jgi:hypothetical protein
MQDQGDRNRKDCMHLPCTIRVVQMEFKLQRLFLLRVEGEVWFPKNALRNMQRQSMQRSWGDIHTQHTEKVQQDNREERDRSSHNLQ